MDWTDLALVAFLGVAVAAYFVRQMAGRQPADTSAAEVAPQTMHRRSDVVREHARQMPAARGEGHVAAVPMQAFAESRARDIINESLDIAAKTKRKDTAESRLGLVEQLLNEIDEAGRTNDEDRINRHTLMRLREVLALRFGRASKLAARPLQIRP